VVIAPVLQLSPDNYTDAERLLEKVLSVLGERKSGRDLPTNFKAVYSQLQHDDRSLAHELVMQLVALLSRPLPTVGTGGTGRTAAWRHGASSPHRSPQSHPRSHNPCSQPHMPAQLGSPSPPPAPLALSPPRQWMCNVRMWLFASCLCRAGVCYSPRHPV
jgi:hypothetical protein